MTRVFAAFALGLLVASAMPVAASALEGSILLELQGIRRAVIRNCEATYVHRQVWGSSGIKSDPETRDWQLARRCWR